MEVVEGPTDAIIRRLGLFQPWPKSPIELPAIFGDELEEPVSDAEIRGRDEIVEFGRVRDFMLAMDEPFELTDRDPVPPLFMVTFGRIRRPKVTGQINGGDDIESILPVHVGDRITTVERIVETIDKTGPKGTMKLLKAEITYTNQRAERVGINRKTYIRLGL